MKQTEILDSLKNYISSELLEGQDIGLDASTPLLEWGIINSLEMARLVTFIQNQFEVVVPADKIIIQYFKNLTSITNLVVELTQREPAA
jgi:medium-chain acyl-[acyl-carrier-protein] hydrolase